MTRRTLISDDICGPPPSPCLLGAHLWPHVGAQFGQVIGQRVPTAVVEALGGTLGEEEGEEEEREEKEDADQREPRMHQRCCYTPSRPMSPSQSPCEYPLPHLDARP